MEWTMRKGLEWTMRKCLSSLKAIILFETGLLYSRFLKIIYFTNGTLRLWLWRCSKRKRWRWQRSSGGLLQQKVNAKRAKQRYNRKRASRGNTRHDNLCRLQLGRKFTVETDQRALVWLNKSKVLNGRPIRWSLAQQNFEFHVNHEPGRNNSNVDNLSRAH